MVAKNIMRLYSTQALLRNMLVAPKEAHRFVADCLRAAGSPSKPAEDMADLLVQADLFGHYSHGMNRLELYVGDLLYGSVSAIAQPVILKESPATAWVDGRNALGATVGHFAMDVAIAKAKNVGVGVVSVKGTNHFGIAGYWALKAEREGLLGMALTNTSPFMAPTRSKTAALGTNPIALAAPVNQGDGFLLDMATTAVAAGKIEMQRRKGTHMPSGWAQDLDGKITNDPHLPFEQMCLMPLGGSEETSGYKGYGLGALVEIFCGILSGSDYGRNIRMWSTTGDAVVSNLGQCFIAIDPDCFAPGFKDRMEDIMKDWRSLPSIDPNSKVLAPGDKEREHADTTISQGGIKYVKNMIKTCNELSTKLGVEPIKGVPTE